MPKEIWNEGRVTGYSAYEIYTKQHLSENPDTPPATEKEWLASSLAMGSSMILQVPNITSIGSEDMHRYIDIQMPINTSLAAANTIVASFFDGAVELDGNWGIRVTDYGQLLSNNATASPSGVTTPASPLPTQYLQDFQDTKLVQLEEYMKIVDGVFIQPGEWTDSELDSPSKDFKANLGQFPKIRLHIKGNITHKPLILLTGFTIRGVLSGLSGTDSSLHTENPQNGDFLGPPVFPWAGKIVFCVPNSYINHFVKLNYSRRLASDPSYLSLTNSIAIDMKSESGSAGTTTPKLASPVQENYYKTTIPETDALFYPKTVAPTYDKQNSRVLDTVERVTGQGDGLAVFTVYQKKSIYPPALYTTFVSATGKNYLHPIDIVAPGTVKMFSSATVENLKDYEANFPGAVAINKTDTGNLQIINKYGALMDMANMEVFYLSTGDTATGTFRSPRELMSGNLRPKAIRINTGEKSVYALALSDIGKGMGTNGKLNPPNQLKMDSKPISIMTLNTENSDNNLTWAALLDALTNNYAIDILGSRLKSAKSTLIRPRTSTAGGGPFIEFGPQGSTIRLYVSDQVPDPTNVPVGSIGIGWGFKK